MSSRSSLPPLASVRVFEAAARHKNFTAASEELGMTQAAVSYQVKVLEERIGEPLFQRHARGVTLTPSGARLAGKLTDALNMIADAYSEARGNAFENLTISSIPTFATNFLAQRIGQFHMENPNVAVRIELSDTLVAFPSSDADLAIRSGFGEWPDVIARKLIQTITTPMLSPGLIEAGKNCPLRRTCCSFHCSIIQIPCGKHGSKAPVSTARMHGACRATNRARRSLRRRPPFQVRASRC